MKQTSSHPDAALFDAELQGQALNLRLLRRLLAWLAPYRRILWVSAVLALLASALQILMPVVISLVAVDRLIMGSTSGDSPDFGLYGLTMMLAQALALPPLVAACLLYALWHIGWACTSHWHRLTLNRAVVRGLRDLRQQLFAHLETQSAAFFDKVAVGRLMTRINNDVEVLYELLRGLGTLIGEFIPFFVALVVMFAISPKLTAILLLILPIAGMVTTWFRNMTRSLFRQTRLSLSALNQYMQENLAGLSVVQISDREEANYERYTDINGRNRVYERRSATYETFYGAFNDAIASVSLALIIWFGGGDAVQGHMTLGEVILFTRFIDMLFQPVVALGEQYNVLFRAMASGERIFESLDWDESLPEPERPAQLPTRLRGKIEFRDLRFEYSPGQQVIKGVSCTIEAGAKIAIVGHTGSGKSTLIRLLTRLYQVPDGTIFLDDVDINRIHSSDLRRRLGVVLQDFHIFSGSLIDNITLGNPNVDRAAAMAAAKTANAHPFITKLPQGYDTPLAERGQNLSQGERQLLAFARVLAANPEILVLDEATANIDTNTETLIQEAMRTLIANRTAIIIAHRLQTIREVDQVLVFDHGEIVESGTHAELLAARGQYHRLHALQFQDTALQPPEKASEPHEEEEDLPRQAPS